MAKTTTITTLGPSVRLVVFKFLMKSDLIPDLVPRVPVNRDGAVPTVKGEQVLPSTPNVWLTRLIERFFSPGQNLDYEFVGARVAEERGDGKSDVRFTFCHRLHLNESPPHPDFVSRRDHLVQFFTTVFAHNLWSVQGYLNLYLLKNGVPTRHKVLMLNCAGRKEVINPDGTPVMVYEGGREKLANGFSQGIGPKVPLLDKASRLELVRNKVQLVTP